MKMKHLFYDSTINLKVIKTSKLVLAVIIGLLSSVVIYAFFYVLRETFRIISTSYDQLPQILSKENRDYYNLFFAALSMVFANSIAFNFIFSRPQRIAHRFNSKRKRLLNDNIFLSFNFSYWFTKIGLVFGVFSMCCMDFEFLPYFKSISLLLIVVLYLESLKSFGFFLKNKKRLVFFVIHFSFLLISTFTLSRFDVVNYKALDEVMLKNNPIINLPEADFSEYQDTYQISTNLKLKVDALDMINIYDYERKLSLEDVPDFITTYKQMYREEMIPHMIVNIEADKNIKLKYIKQLERQLLKSNIYKVSYIIKNEDKSFSRVFRKGITKTLNPEFYKMKPKDFVEPPLVPFTNLNKLKKDVVKDSAIISIANDIKFNGVLVNKTKLKSLFLKHQSSDFLFIYDIKDNAIYQNYIDVIASHVEVIKQLRRKYQTIFQNNKYHKPKGFYKEQLMLKKQFPLMIEEKIECFNLKSTP